MAPSTVDLVTDLTERYTTSVSLSDHLKDSQWPSTSAGPSTDSVQSERRSVLLSAYHSERKLEDFLHGIEKKKTETSKEDLLLQQCRLCGVLLSPTNCEEVILHLRAHHASEFRSQYLAWLQQRDEEVRETEAQFKVRKFRRIEHPVWSLFRRVCTLCLNAVRTACSTNLLKHLDYHHPEASRDVKSRWETMTKTRGSRRPSSSASNSSGSRDSPKKRSFSARSN